MEVSKGADIPKKEGGRRCPRGKKRDELPEKKGGNRRATIRKAKKEIPTHDRRRVQLFSPKREQDYATVRKRRKNKEGPAYAERR